MAQVVPSGRGVMVAYDPARLTPERIADAVTKDTGYLVRRVEAACDAGR